MQNGENHDAGDPSADDIDGIVGLDIDGGKAHQHEQRDEGPEEPSVLGAPG